MAGLFSFMFNVAFGALTVTLAVPRSGVISILVQLGRHGMEICWRLSIEFVDGFEAEVASIWAVNSPHPKLEYIIPSEPVQEYYTCKEHITDCSYLQGIQGLVNNGAGEFLIILQRKVASSVALNVKVSLFAEDSVYAPFTLKFSIKTIKVTENTYICIDNT